MTTIFGIANCDKCRAALKWFASSNLEHKFHDLRIDGLQKKQLQNWLKRSDAATLINRRSTTWRQLSEEQKALTDDAAICELALEFPTLLKRPLVDDGTHLIVGYDEAAWNNNLG